MVFGNGTSQIALNTESPIENPPRVYVTTSVFQLDDVLRDLTPVVLNDQTEN